MSSQSSEHEASVRQPGLREIRARFDDHSLTVYQAYSAHIADAALAAGTFVSPFKRERMTWIKPSFLWMMYRSGWSTKPGQERVLAIRIKRVGFEWALANSCLSQYEPAVYPSREARANRKKGTPVRIQWDPERSVGLQPLPYRTIQVGLSGEAVSRYVEDWILSIEDMTEFVSGLSKRSCETHNCSLPIEKRYSLPRRIADQIGATQT